ncbi:Eco57I restriction-modification methylase domain-containing protein [Pelobacter propionicus]|uniref:site-specific DNA-methyltransferase (adenine-specific) n=1 Tax=Pelobacter propionicus (strain DSM 2379 / NBRC 103807 / OttBd1) TaxID=338966 RepID=A0R825_PELPD|nr:DNA methyltransferase [Pelobacter propionicus]ABL01260.1 hypothetical protein Ppro_3668 [Pelobacter propionicus DSM 2379]
MSIKKTVCSKLIKNFQLRELFNQLGWNHATKKEPVAVNGQVYQLEAIADKSAFFVFVCETSGKVPDYATRKKIDSAITKLYHQHLIIFIDSNKRQQVWQLVLKELDKPAVVRETPYFSTQEPELLYQKLQHLFFSIDEEDNITVVDVTGRVQTGFNTNAEKITKKFYEGFKKEHTAFLAFIIGIPEPQDKDWYASLMLNRLMFIYFIQKKGFLNNDKFYLKTKLAETQSRKGKDKFYSFYRNFLLVLFHKGLGSPDNKKFESELGKVPYLNGGLFDVHELEITYTDIKIEDKAFERIFSFFDQYEWHLDTRQQATGKEINPDVIGYIFEKYINDRAAMGAYYTKEDITDYIGKNCIIPFLFDELKRLYAFALKKGGDIWKQLQKNPNDYIYPAIQYGVELELPAGIAKGLEDVSKREEWNKAAPAEYALPTEIWREVVERRRRYAEVKEKIEAGDIHEINDLITYNLDITKFAIDVIQNSIDAELIRHFYKALEKITILDPTCGSGAFLFAALNVLEPLYEACIVRMHSFVAEAAKGKYKTFDEVLKRVDAPEHPNLQYFIFKSIILNNLFGVDIMNEAIEIAKLRLFLKLVATVDVDYKKPNMGLEPLPDIDFNIRSGNTLVGFVSIDEVKKAVEGQLGFHDKDIASIEEAADYVKRAFSAFREAQIENDITKKGAKKQLVERLHKLNDRLDVYLGKLYGKDPKKTAEYKSWHDSHKPFHWFAEYYEIIHDRGGFDVVIGNPPYVEYGEKLKKVYRLLNYQTIECGNLHSYVAERAYKISRCEGFLGFIVPLPSINTDRMKPLQALIKPSKQLPNRTIWISSFDERPSKLFVGVDQRLIIEIIGSVSKSPKIFSTGINRWSSTARHYLFNYLYYSMQDNNVSVLTDSILKIKYNKFESNMLYRLYTNEAIEKYKSFKPTENILAYRTAGGRYWKAVSNKEFDSESLSNKIAYLSGISGNQAVAIVSSSTFWWYYSVHYDMYNLKDYMIFGFRFSGYSESIAGQLEKLGSKLAASIETNSKLETVYSKTRGDVTSRRYVISKSKPLIDEIDHVLAKHYGFSSEELDFIINYDIKYRMGKSGAEENGDE